MFSHVPPILIPSRQWHQACVHEDGTPTPQKRAAEEVMAAEDSKMLCFSQTFKSETHTQSFYSINKCFLSDRWYSTLLVTAVGSHYLTSKQQNY